MAFEGMTEEQRERLEKYERRMREYRAEVGEAEFQRQLEEQQRYLESLGVGEPFTEEQARAAAPAYSGVHARMFPFPLVIARLANFRDIYERRHAWFKRLHDLLHPLI